MGFLAVRMTPAPVLVCEELRLWSRTRLPWMVFRGAWVGRVP